MDFRIEESFLNEKEFKNQSKKMFNALFETPLTRFEVAKLIDVDRSNICRYVAYLFDRDLIAITKKRRCTISGYPYVEELTTNRDLFPEDNQTYFDFLD
jgi:predicted transcriptional regulator